MKLVVEEGGHSAYFHSDVLLAEEFTSRRALKTEGETKATRAKEAIAKILGLQGIQDVSIDRYKVAVERSKAVPWEEIIPKVEAILREVYETPASVEVAPVVGLSQGDGL